MILYDKQNVRRKGNLNNNYSGSMILPRNIVDIIVIGHFVRGAVL